MQCYWLVGVTLHCHPCKIRPPCDVAIRHNSLAKCHHHPHHHDHLTRMRRSDSCTWYLMRRGEELERCECRATGSLRHRRTTRQRARWSRAGDEWPTWPITTPFNCSSSISTSPKVRTGCTDWVTELTFNVSLDTTSAISKTFFEPFDVEETKPNTTRMSVLLIVGPKCTLAASRFYNAAPGESRWVHADGPDRQTNGETDGRQTITLYAFR